MPVETLFSASVKLSKHLFEKSGVVEEQTLANEEAQRQLEAGYNANADAEQNNARANEDSATSNQTILRSLGNLPNDKILHAERQSDSFLREFNDNDAKWRKLKNLAKENAADWEDLDGSGGGAGSALKDTNKQ